jgi:hypothetical protein
VALRKACTINLLLKITDKLKPSLLLNYFNNQIKILKAEFKTAFKNDCFLRVADVAIQTFDHTAHAKKWLSMLFDMGDYNSLVWDFDYGDSNGEDGISMVHQF